MVLLPSVHQCPVLAFSHPSWSLPVLTAGVGLYGDPSVLLWVVSLDFSQGSCVYFFYGLGLFPLLAWGQYPGLKLSSARNPQGEFRGAKSGGPWLGLPGLKAELVLCGIPFKSGVGGPLKHHLGSLPYLLARPGLLLHLLTWLLCTHNRAFTMLRHQRQR